MDCKLLSIVCAAALSAGSLCAGAEAQDDVVFRDCPKCEMCARISADANRTRGDWSCFSAYLIIDHG